MNEQRDQKDQIGVLMYDFAKSEWSDAKINFPFRNVSAALTNDRIILSKSRSIIKCECADD